VTGPDEVLQKLEEVASGIEKLNLQQMTVEPKRTQELVDVLYGIKEAVEAARDWQREQRNEERLAALFAEFGKYTAAAHERLATSEARLQEIEHAVVDGRRRRVRVKPEIIDEGKYLKGVLAGPPSDADDPQYLKDAARVPIKASIDVIADGLSTRAKTTTAKTTARKS
jgi:hypothetical protein